MQGIVIAGGEMHDYDRFRPIAMSGGLLVCADSGLVHAQRMGLVPNAVVGDFDSAPAPEDPRIDVVRYPADKDYSDTYLAVEYALAHGCTELTLLGAFGSRFDHTLANYHLLYYLLRKGIPARMCNEENEVFLTDGTCKLSGQPGDKVALIPLMGDVEGVFAEGLLYPLQGQTLRFDVDCGISNEMTGESACITTGGGVLAVIRYSSRL